MTFLATTSLNKFWNKQAKNGIFLGEWCKIYSKKKEYEQLNFDTLKYIWSDLEELDNAFEFCDKLYPKLLSYISNILNKYHDTNHTNDYWDIILRPWLYQYIHVIYDKYRHIKLAKDTYKDIYTYTLDENSYEFVSNCENFLSHVGKNDKYNLQIYSQIIKHLNINNTSKEYTKKTINTSIIYKSTKKERIRRYLTRNLNKILNKKQVLIVNPCFKQNTNKRIAKLSLYSNFLFVFDQFYYDFNFELNGDIKERQKLFNMNNAASNTEFETILYGTLLYNFPLLYLEGYELFNSYVKKLSIETPDIIYSANALRNKDIFNFYLASHREKLIFTYGQHGGGYGIDKRNTPEEIERKLSDIYFTFGWKSDKTKVLPLSEYNSTSNGKSSIIYIMTEKPRYLFNFSYLGDSSKGLIYINNSLNFLKSLNQNIKQDLVIRPYMQKYGWNIKERLMDIDKNFVLDNKIDFYEQISSSKLNIFDHLHTSYLESLSMNKPTIIVLPKTIYNFRDTTKKYFKTLEELKILFYDTEEAARFIDTIYLDIDKWWLSKDIQEFRKVFCSEFIRTSSTWDNEWINTFKNILE